MTQKTAEAVLTAKQSRFVDEYLCDLNATQAAIRAGYSPKTAYRTGADNLRKPQIAAAIDAANQERSKRTEVAADDVIQQLARMGFADIRKLFTPGGQLRSVHDLDDDIAAAIASIEVVTKTIPGVDDEGSEVEYIHKVKLVDKIKPLELIGRHLGKRLGEWAEKMEHTGKDGGPIQHDVQAITADMDPVEASRLYREHLNATTKA